MSVEFLLTALVVCLIPGTGVLYTIAIGLGLGFRAAAIAALGCTLGIVPHALASIAGLAALLHTSALVFQVVKGLGLAYLLFMAWSMLREGSALEIHAARRSVPAFRLVRDGILLNLLNPNLSLFFLAFLPQFIPAASPAPTEALAGLALVFMALTLVVFLAYGAGAALARDYVISRPAVMRWLRRSFAASFAALGLRLALAER